MDGIREFLEAVRQHGLAAGHVRGLLHVAIGRRVSRRTGEVLSTGLTWRELAALLKDMRFDRELVREYGADPDALSPRDRQRFWYAAIAAAHVNSREAIAEADDLAQLVAPLGFDVGPAPLGPPSPPPPPPPPDTSRPRKKK